MSRGRNHLRHLVKNADGHGFESRALSQGCAAVHAWLRDLYPNSTVTREEYTNAAGERRADVLLTGHRGDRVAFEVQYSPLTPEQWQQRHDSYRSQGIVDVWLFGSTTAKVRDDGWFVPSPMHEASLRAGAPLLLIGSTDPEQVTVTVAGVQKWLPQGGRTFVISPNEGIVEMDTHPLSEFAAEPADGITHAAITTVRARTEHLRKKEAEKEAADEARKREQADLHARRTAHVEVIGELLNSYLTEGPRWATSTLQNEMRRYFSRQLKDRIDIVDGALVEWQSILYFTFIAGKYNQDLPGEIGFTVPQMAAELKRHRVPVPTAETPWKAISAWLKRLRNLELVNQSRGVDGYPVFYVNIRGSMW